MKTLKLIALAAVLAAAPACKNKEEPKPATTEPEGEPTDPPERETVRGLGNRKDVLFRDRMAEQGVPTDDAAVRLDFIHQPHDSHDLVEPRRRHVPQ